MIEKVDTLVIGAGQAGVAMSEHLSRYGLSHLVLERHRIAERWRSERWDSLVTNGPAWHDRFPGLEFPDDHPDSFVPKDRVAEYFEAYARNMKAPIRCGVNVEEVRRHHGHAGFQIKTSQGLIDARNVVVATGAFQNPVIPPLVPNSAPVLQMHSNAYRNPTQLPSGSVLVIGAGSSGVQIADELLRSGKRVYLSIGPHDRPPRSYRGLDFCWWLGVLGKWDATVNDTSRGHVTIAVSGAYGGQTIDFRRLAANGMTLLGMASTYQNDRMTFLPDLKDNMARSDANYLSVLDEADRYAVAHAIELPEDPDARQKLPDPDCVTNPILELEFSSAGITTVIWATGYKSDYSWLKVDVLDEKGEPRHQRGVTSEQGLCFLGLPWQSRRGSSFIWGVWHDAKYIADHYVTQQQYNAHYLNKLTATPLDFYNKVASGSV